MFLKPNRSFRDLNLGSGMSSPLTSLSSLDDPDERQLPGLSLPLHDPEDLKVAQVNILTIHLITNSNIVLSSFRQLLCSLQRSRKSVAVPSSTSTINGFIRKTADTGVQTEPEHVIPARNRDVKQPKINAVPKVGTLQYHNKLSFRHLVNKASPFQARCKWIDRSLHILSKRSNSYTS
jgi:hypothetical protein